MSAVPRALSDWYRGLNDLQCHLDGAYTLSRSALQDLTQWSQKFLQEVVKTHPDPSPLDLNQVQRRLHQLLPSGLGSLSHSAATRALALYQTDRADYHQRWVVAPAAVATLVQMLCRDDDTLVYLAATLETLLTLWLESAMESAWSRDSTLIMEQDLHRVIWGDSPTGPGYTSVFSGNAEWRQLTTLIQ